VKVINIDPTGKIRLSRKALLTPEEGGAPPQSETGEEAGAAAGGNREGGHREGGHHREGGGHRGGRDRFRGPRRDRE
jgi:polyribonucleotide nucleotidyltransferase